MATLRATTSGATPASFFPGAIWTSKLAIRLGAATIGGSMTIGGRSRIRFSCLGAKVLELGRSCLLFSLSLIRGTATICPLSDKSGHCSAAVLISTATLPLPLRKFPELPVLLRTIIFGGMKPDLFRDLPEDCTCDGQGLAPG